MVPQRPETPGSSCSGGAEEPAQKTLRELPSPGSLSAPPALLPAEGADRNFGSTSGLICSKPLFLPRQAVTAGRSSSGVRMPFIKLSAAPWGRGSRDDFKLSGARNNNLICRGFLDSHENPHYPHQGTETGIHYMLFNTSQARSRLFKTRTQIGLLTPSQRPPGTTPATAATAARSRSCGRSGSEPSTRSL